MSKIERRYFLQSLATLALATPWLPVRAADAPLRMGVHPYSSTLALVATHRPLVQYLERTLQRSIEFYTAANFDAYLKSLMAGEYDIVITPPHFGVLAIEKKEYLPLANYQARLEPMFVVSKSSRIDKASDFAGKRIAMSDKTAFIRIVMVKQLADAGLIAGRDYEIVERPTHGASVLAVIRGEADAGLATFTVMKLQPPDVVQQLRPVLADQTYPNLFTLAHQRLGSLLGPLKKALREFADSPEGKLFFEKTGYFGFDDITAAELAALTPYIQMTRQLLPVAQ